MDEEAAVAIVHARGEEESVLLMRRAEREGDSWSGHWSFPGGRRDVEDSDLLHTALRELREECGVELLRSELEAELPPRFARRKAGASVRVTPFLFRSEAELAVVPDQLEAVEAVWVPLRLLADPARHRLLAVPGMPPEALFPAVELGAAPLWGFTYRLISDWLRLSPPAGSAGFEAASAVLDFLKQYGLAVLEGWTGSNGGARTTARVSGPIPVDAVRGRFSTPGPHVHSVNCLEALPGRIRILGLAFEEYVIVAAD